MPPPPPRHTPTRTLTRIATILGILVAIVLGISYIVYEFKLSAAVFRQDGSQAMHALSVLAYMRGGVLIVAGVALMVAAGIEYWRDTSSQVLGAPGASGASGGTSGWTGQDTGEVVLGIAGVVWGGVVMGWKRFGLV